jgi:hypothetical protein
MISSKVERAKYGPSTVEVCFGALLSFLLGAVLAVGYLIIQPVQIGKTPAKGEPASAIVFIAGTKDGDRGKQWLRKKQLFTEGSSVEVNEDELNAWITAGTAPEPPKPAKDKKPEQPAKDKKPEQSAKDKQPDQAAPAASTSLIQFGTPNFRVANGMFQMGSEGELNLDFVGVKRPLVMQASGRFQKTAEGFAFVPDQFYLGCCPLHKLPGVAKLVLDRVLENEKIPGDLSSAWKKLADVSVEGNVLRLSVQ